MSVSSSQSSQRVGARWLFGPSVDLLLGCGLSYPLIVGLLFRSSLQMAQIGPWLPLIILLTGIPHYGATLLRVSATAADRRRYGLPAIVLSVIAAGGFVAGLSLPLVGSLLITAYLSLSPWHYAAQNYGIAMMFLRRNNVPVTNLTRRLLRASFVTSFALVLLSYHQAGAAGGYDPLYAASASFRFLPLGVPSRVILVGAPLLFALHAITLGAALWQLCRGKNRRALIPALSLFVSQSLWFSIPALIMLRWPGRYPGHHVALAFIWIAVGHCVQYLWISTYFHRAARSAKSGAGASSTASYLIRATLIGSCVWVVPALLFAPGALGKVSFDAGLGLLVAALVNLHHFALDAMIWRLREPRIGALLVNGQNEAATELEARRARSGPPSLATCTLITVGALSIFIWLMSAWEREFGHRRAYAARDLTRLSQASERLAAMGRDGAPIHVALGKLKAQQGLREEAAAEFQHALRLDPNHREALRSYEKLLSTYQQD